MIKYTDLEKQKAKEARKAFKQGKFTEQKRIDDIRQEYQSKAEKVKQIIKTGIFDSEREMDLDDNVFWDYVYIVSDDGGKLIISDIQGKVRDLIRNLRSRGYTAEKIYTCDFVKRNIF